MPSALPKILVLCCALLAAACGRAREELVLSGPTMGTTYTVKVVAPPASVDGARLRETIDQSLAQIDRSMSGYRADSEVTRFNASTSTQWHDVSAELAAVVQTALDISEKSGGAFDITVAPLVAAWGFGPGGRPQELPGAEQIARTGASVGFRKLHVRSDPPALRKDVAELAIDLNGIAPGFAVDLLAASIAGAARRELHDRHRRRNSRTRPQCARRAVAHRNRASSGYAAHAVRWSAARRCVGLDIRRISRLLRARWSPLLAHHRPAHRAASRSRAWFCRRRRAVDCVGGWLGDGAQRAGAARWAGARRDGAHAGVVHRARWRRLALAVDAGVRALSERKGD